MHFKGLSYQKINVSIIPEVTMVMLFILGEHTAMSGHTTDTFVEDWPLVQLPMCQESESDMQCTNDCRTMLTCIGAAGQPILARTCAHIDPTKPYCVKGVCQAIPDVDDDGCSTTTCTAAGVFPDITDCNKYHYCQAYADKSVLLACPENCVYNATLNVCLYTTNTTCAIADCTGNVGRMVLYPQNPAFFVFCGIGGPTNEMYILKCEDTENEIFDISLNRCRFNCRAAGKFADRSNRHGYIECSPKANATWTMSKKLCYDGEIFTNGACGMQVLTKYP